MKANGQMILRNIAGENILIPTGATALKIHGMITLTESGLLLWQKLQNECTEAELTDAILAEYDIDRESAEADVKEFLAKLEQIGILER